MRSVATTLVFALAMTLAACSHLATRSPVGVDLSGTWVLDAPHSDSPPPLRRHTGAEFDRRYADGSMPRFGGPMPLLPMLSAAEMTIAQDPVSMGIAYPDSPYRDLKWGTEKRDLYTVDAGWDDTNRLVIETRSKPLDVREVYSLNASGDTLTLQIELSGQRIDKRQFTRVFHRKAVQPAR